MIRWMLQVLAVVAALAGPVIVARHATAQAEPPAFAGRTLLLKHDDRACIHCRKWEREVQQGYLASAEGRVAPLVKRPRGHADLKGIAGLVYTPTFVLIANGREVGRIVGYAGPDFFWGELDRLFRGAGLMTPPAGMPPTRADTGAATARDVLVAERGTTAASQYFAGGNF